MEAVAGDADAGTNHLIDGVSYPKMARGMRRAGRRRSGPSRRVAHWRPQALRRTRHGRCRRGSPRAGRL